jgi:hypothetical protein
MTLDPASERLFEGGSDGVQCRSLSRYLGNPSTGRSTRREIQQGFRPDRPCRRTQRMPASQCNTFSTKRALCDAFGLFIPTGSRSSPLT